MAGSPGRNTGSNFTLPSRMQITTLAFVILVGATIFSLVFRSFGGEEVVTHALDRIPGGVLGAIIAINILIFFLGFFLDFIEIVFIIMTTALVGDFLT